MAAPTDFLHDEQVVDAVCDQLKAYLPAKWTAGYDPLFKLEHLAFGDLVDFRLPPGQTWADQCPAILVRALGNRWSPEEGSSQGGGMGIIYDLALVHVWSRDQCRDGTSPGDRVEVPRSKAQRLKTVNQALFGDTTRRLGSPTLTCADSGAAKMILTMEYVGTTFEPAYLPPNGEFVGFETTVRVYTSTTPANT